MAFSESQREILFRMGFALLMMQTTEQLINMCLTYVLPEGGVITLEMLERSNRKKRTLGQFLIELRKRVDVDQHFDVVLEEFITKRNALIHRVADVPGWSLDNQPGCQIALQFIDRVIILDETVRDTFVALLAVWQNEADIATPVDHMFGNVETYRKIVNHTFFEKE